MGPFGGWIMPIQYAGILAEHTHTRAHVSVFDTCHMGELIVSGPKAAEDLDRLVTSSIAGLSIGQCRYGYLLNDEGGVLDDVTCYRLDDTRYMLVVNAGTRESDAAWVRERLSPDTRFEDRSDTTAKLDVQGPEARAAAEEALGVSLPDLKYFRFALALWEGSTLLVSRSGYTGEFGYEFYAPAERAVDLWQGLLAPGRIRPAGLGARDTLRLEVGYPLYGHELSPARTPVAAARGRFIDRTKAFFHGRTAVERDLEAGCERYLTGLRLAGKASARTGDAVGLDGEVVGEVTSGSFAPSLGVAVALAYVRADIIAAGRAVEVLYRGRGLPAVPVEPPFYKEGTAR